MAQATKENTLSKYIEQRQQAINYRFEQASVLISWRNQMTRLANEARARMREQRENGIRVRLSTEACVPQYLWCQLYAVNFPQRKEAHELTDDEWRYIRADVIEYLFDHSENQLRTSITHTLTAGIRALDAVLQQFVVTRPRIAPTAFHVASSNPYLQMVKSSAADHTVNDVLEQVAQLPAFITGWRLDTDNYLASLIPQPRRWRSMDNDPNLLGLATSFFRCDMCTEPISYPRILMHHCFLRPTKAIAEKAIQRKEKKNTPRDPRPLQLITADTVLPSLSYTFGEGMHPDRAGVAFHQVASKSARMIILGCRENPDIITYGEMDLKDFRVECLLCSSSGRGRLVMRWTIAILHDLAKHSNKISSQTHWQLVDSVEDEEKIKAKETQMIKKSNMPAQYCCRLCDEKVMKNLVALHLSRVYRK